jgi:hypothetical protein
MDDILVVKQRKEAAMQVISILEKNTNNMAFDNEAFAEEMANEFFKCHRTLQQGIIRVIAAFIAKAGDGSFDLRNEAAIAWCKKVGQIYRHFPFI